MIEFEVREIVMGVGQRKGQTVYYAAPKSTQRITQRQVEDEIVRATSLARGDVRNALTSLAEIVRDALQQGASIDLGDLGAIKIVVSSKMVDTPQEVNASTLKTPAVRFTPKQEMLNAAKKVQLKVDNPYTKKPAEGGGNGEGDGGL